MEENIKSREMRYTIVMTEACNLRCKYCYVPHNPKTITTDVIDAFLDMIDEEVKTGPYKVSIDAFGGEPLLAWEQLEHLVIKANERWKIYRDNVRITIFSNATLFTEEKLKFLKSSTIPLHFNFSVDGNKACHDSARVYKDGSGSWDDVIKGVDLYKKVYNRKEDYFPTIKFMVAPSNVHHVVDVVKYVAERGSRIGLSIVRDGVWDDEFIEIYRQNINEVAEYFIQNIDKGLWIDTFSIPILDGQARRQSFCSAGVYMFGVAPNGDIYPCQRFYNNRSPYKLGTVFTGIEKDNKWKRLFEQYTVDNFVGCGSCTPIGKNRCTGQCLAAMYEANKNMFVPIKNVCKLLKINYEIAHQVYEVLKDNPNYQKTLDRNSYGG